jgi:predicted HTH transcriptional regulator
MSLSTVRSKIKDLKDNGKIERIGSDKTGHWKIIE